MTQMSDGLPILIHIHIPRAGGTTINAAVGQAFRSKNHFPLKPDEAEAFYRLSQPERDSIDFLFGHMPYGFHRHFTRKANYLACVREPRQRIFSVYQFIRSTRSHPLHGEITTSCEDFSSFLILAGRDARVQDEIDNIQVRLVAGKTDLCPAYHEFLSLALENVTRDNFFTTDLEHLPELFSQLETIYDTAFEATPRLNSSSYSTTFEFEFAALSPAARDNLEKFTKWDVHLYNYITNAQNVQRLSCQALQSTFDTLEETAQLLYRAVLRREPDQSGLAAYTRMLAQGRPLIELLRLICDSSEYRSKILLPRDEVISRRIDDYDIKADENIKAYLRKPVIEMTQTIRTRALDHRSFASAASRAVDMTGGHLGAQIEYLEVHIERFQEIANVILKLGENFEIRNLLDFGLSVNSFIMRELFPNIEIFVADRPEIAIPPNEFSGAIAIDLLDDKLSTIDFNQKFDLIVFSEVIEHVLVHPANIIQFLLRHINESGFVILTTPNLFARSKLSQISKRANPLPPYPVTYTRADAPHFHIREYGMGEMLRMVDDAGGLVQAFFFSACWDEPESRENLPAHELGNLFLLFTRK